eukprot:COSAG04_NODE_7879_length_1052_cov_3.823715_1_plen_173_part_00
MPQACDLECAAELLPFRNACKEVLQSSLGIVLRPLINEAAARCPGFTQAEAQEVECDSLFEVVQNACVGFDAGFPTEGAPMASCSAHCGHAFVQFVDTCSSCRDTDTGCKPPLLHVLGMPSPTRVANFYAQCVAACTGTTCHSNSERSLTCADGSVHPITTNYGWFNCVRTL